MATFERVLGKATNSKWYALLVLARIGALRVPSEIAAMHWADIDWDGRRLRIYSSKTEHHEGHAKLVIPLFPAKFCGHSSEVAQEHYWTTTEADLDAALSDGFGTLSSTATPQKTAEDRDCA